MLLSDSCILAGNKGTVKGYAKVNLTLDVLSKRPDGYHDISTIMRTVDIFDTVEISLTDEDIELSTSLDFLPTDEKNIAYRAAQAIFSETGIQKGAKIHITKNIPCGAGMGGGSADGAAVLVLLNKLLGSPVSTKRLLEIGAKIGADVPFCIMCGTYLAEGIGEVLSEVFAKGSIPVVVVKPEVSISTPLMYKKLDEREILKRPDTKGMINVLEKGNTEKIAELLYNVMEEAAIEEHPIISEIKESLIKKGAINAIMTGSGSAVFGIFKTTEEADKCAKDLSGVFGQVFSSNLI